MNTATAQNEHLAKCWKHSHNKWHMTIFPGICYLLNINHSKKCLNYCHCLLYPMCLFRSTFPCIYIVPLLQAHMLNTFSCHLELNDHIFQLKQTSSWELKHSHNIWHHCYFPWKLLVIVFQPFHKCLNYCHCDLDSNECVQICISMYWHCTTIVKSTLLNSSHFHKKIWNTKSRSAFFFSRTCMFLCGSNSSKVWIAVCLSIARNTHSADLGLVLLKHLNTHRDEKYNSRRNNHKILFLPGNLCCSDLCHETLLLSLKPCAWAMDAARR